MSPHSFISVLLVFHTGDCFELFSKYLVSYVCLDQFWESCNKVTNTNMIKRPNDKKDVGSAKRIK